jgi:hypothetical protein
MPLGFAQDESGLHWSYIPRGYNPEKNFILCPICKRPMVRYRMLNPIGDLHKSTDDKVIGVIMQGRYGDE